MVGEIASAPTGAIRSTDAASYRYDLISPIGLRRIAETYAEGAKKYGDKNWEMGFPISDILNHCIRHIYLFLSGDRSEDHLAHAGWNVIAAMHSQEKWPTLNQDLRAGNCELSDLQRSEILARNAKKMSQVKVYQ